MANQEFQKVSVKTDVKREIDILAAREQRHVYEIVEDMLKLYKQVVKKSTRKPASTVDVVSDH